MDSNNKISFIPKKSLARTDFSGKKPISLFLTLSFSIFLITCAVYGGAYIYTQTLEKGIDVKKKELQELRNNFDLSIIDKAKDLKARMKSAQELVNQHIALSSFFDFLEQATLKSVGYSSFQYSNKDGKLEATLSGMAPNYASVALQRDGLSLETENKGRLSSFSMGGYKLDENGNVSFTLKAALNPSLFLYKNGFSAMTAESTLIPENSPQPSLEDIEINQNQ